MSLDYADPVFVFTRLLPGATKPHAYDRCSKNTLISGREVVEHVWGHAASPNTPCACGAMTLQETGMLDRNGKLYENLRRYGLE